LYAPRSGEDFVFDRDTGDLSQSKRFSDILRRFFAFGSTDLPRPGRQRGTAGEKAP